MIAAIFAVAAGAMAWWGFTWRVKADELNEENLGLAQRLDEAERLLAPRPRIEFGPHLDRPKSMTSDSEWADLMTTVRMDDWQAANPALPTNVRRITPAVPKQRQPKDAK